MQIETININDKNVWLVIDQLRIYSPDNNSINSCDEYMCYYKLTEPALISASMQGG